MHRENVGAEWKLVLGCVVAPKSTATAALFVTNGGTVVTQDPTDPTDPTNPLSVYVGNKLNFSAVVTGVPTSDIEIRQTYVSGTHTDPVTGQMVQFRGPGDLDGVIFNGTSFGNTGVAVDSDGVLYTPSVTVAPGGAVIFQFYDGPGQAGNPNDFTRTEVNNQTITTAIINRSTGQVLSQQTWTTTSTFNQNGTGSTTFRYHYP